MSPLARLDRRTGCKVVCGRPDCGYVLARVVQIPQGRVAEFAMGWAPNSEGIWALTRHAAARVANGRPPAFRRRPRPDTLRLLPHKPMYRDKYPTPQAYPAQVRCPRCRLVQTLDAQQLRVGIRPRFTTPHARYPHERLRQAVFGPTDERMGRAEREDLLRKLGFDRHTIDLLLLETPEGLAQVQEVFGGPEKFDHWLTVHSEGLALI